MCRCVQCKLLGRQMTLQDLLVMGFDSEEEFHRAIGEKAGIEFAYNLEMNERFFEISLHYVK